MKRTIVLIILVFAITPLLFPVNAQSGGMGPRRTPPLDQSLMQFKEAGIWYFLCISPTYLQRIPPHYQTYGPPPPPCCPMPTTPLMHPPKVKQTLIKPRLVSPVPVQYR